MSARPNNIAIKSINGGQPAKPADFSAATGIKAVPVSTSDDDVDFEYDDADETSPADTAVVDVENATELEVVDLEPVAARTGASKIRDFAQHIAKIPDAVADAAEKSAADSAAKAENSTEDPPIYVPRVLGGTKTSSTITKIAEKLRRNNIFTTIPLNLKRIRTINGDRADGLSANVTNSKGGMRGLLVRMRERSHAYAAMHNAARKAYEASHQILTIVIIAAGVIAGLGAEVNNLVSSEFTLSPDWAILATSVTLALVSMLTAINNFLKFQALTERHRQAKNDHMRVASLVDIAVACDDEDPDTSYNYSSVLEEVQEIHDNLKKGVDLPWWTSRMYPKFEAPWLNRALDGKVVPLVNEATDLLENIEVVTSNV